MVTLLQQPHHDARRSNRADRFQVLNCMSIGNKAQEFGKRALLTSAPNIIWQIERGIVRSTTFDEDGNLVVLGLWGPGDTIGKPYSQIEPYQLECVTSVRAASIYVDNFAPDASVFCYHLHQAEELMVIRSYHKIDRILVRLLEWIADRFGTNSGRDKIINFKITHQDLADILGSTRVSISRTLKQLERGGTIARTSSNEIVIKPDRRTIDRVHKLF
jgi:CRP-like cAMP-binding protein